MMPQKFVKERQRSAPARCTRMVGESLSGEICGAPLVMFFSPSPISAWPFETLVIQRCPEHLARADGVLSESQESSWRW